jgi:hypothetical protein
LKKIFFQIIVLLFAVKALQAQDAWVTHKIDNRVSVKFPNQPKEVNPGCFVSTDKDSTVYFFLGLDMKMLDIDSTHLEEYYHTPEGLGHLKQIITRGFPDSDIGDLKIGTWKGLTSYTTSGINTSTQKKIYVFMFIMTNKKLYIQFISIPNGKSTKARDDYFGSTILNE